ncbi:AsmA family protein [Roseovarius sp. 2305UL8-3]|uniref:AsmA family protein n=1 Tax=Roseovarius conchicola TaxID=3121636 RepID=UPI00352728B7
MRLLIRLVGLVIVVALVALISLLLLPSERIASIAADQISKQTGRTVTLEGETRVTFWPILGVSAGKFTVENADWSEAGAMITADAVKIGVEPQALFGGEVRITGLEAQNPTIRLERARDGRVNWEIGVEGVAPSGQSDGAVPARSNALSLTLDRALIQNGSFSYTDHGAGNTLSVSGVDLDLRWPDYAGAATFDISMLPLGSSSTQSIPDSERLHIKGQLDAVGGFVDGQLSGLQATLTAPGGTVAFNGRAGSAPQAAGTLTADFKDTGRVMAALGQPAADIPAGLGRVLSLSTQVTLSDAQNFALRDAVLQLDNNRFTGGADMDLSGDKPKVSAQLRAGALDMSRFGGSDGNDTGGGGSVTTTGWSTSPIDASALALLNGDFALVADSIDLGDLKLAKTRVLATLTRSRLVLDLREVRTYDGLLTGEFVINNRSGLSVGGNLKAEGLNVQSLLRDSTGISRLTGTAAAQVKFLGVGQTMDAIMHSLSGSGSLSSGRGVIEGFDLDRLMRAGDLSGGTTVFDSLTASFTMDKGQVYNDDLLLSLPRASAEGEGRIGLGARDIDYLFTPKLLEGENRRGLAIPVRIRGPWADPRIIPDLERAIDLNLEKEKEELEQRVKEERDKLEEQAKEEVSKRIEKELGVTTEEGQSLEDALKDTLEKELGEGLLDLFQ